MDMIKKEKYFVPDGSCWEFIEPAGVRESGGHLLGLYKCSCGVERVLICSKVRRKRTMMCKKCSNRLNRGKHLSSGTRIYKTWKGIIGRCENPNATGFELYGGKGISVCEEWRNSFFSFQSWAMESGYKDSLTIDRINSSGNYEPENCRWAGAHIQAANQAIAKNNRSGFKGVSFSNSRKKWVASICVNRKSITIGRFENKYAAAMARDSYILKNNLHEYGFSIYGTF